MLKNTTRRRVFVCWDIRSFQQLVVLVFLCLTFHIQFNASTTWNLLTVDRLAAPLLQPDIILLASAVFHIKFIRYFFCLEMYEWTGMANRLFFRLQYSVTLLYIDLYACTLCISILSLCPLSILDSYHLHISSSYLLAHNQTPQMELCEYWLSGNLFYTQVFLKLFLLKVFLLLKI